MEVGYEYETFNELNDGAHQLADLISVGKIDSLDYVFTRVNAAQTNILISSENFSRLNENQSKELLTRLQSFDVRVVYYLRNPLDRIYSQWQELVKHGFRYTLLEYIANILRQPFQDTVLNPMQHLEVWQNAAGAEAVDVVLYDRVQNIPENFMSQFTGAKASGEASGARVNVSNSVEKTEILRALSGAQTALLSTDTFDAELTEIADALINVRDESGKSFARTFSLSWDTAILQSVEKNIAAKLGFPHDESNPFFEKRVKEYSYYLNTVWVECDGLKGMLDELRQNIKSEFPSIPYDERLRYME